MFSDESPIKSGDATIAICNECQLIQECTYKIRDVALSDGSYIVKNILVGTCNKCNRVVSLPHQEVDKVHNKIKEVHSERSTHKD